MGQKVNPHGLRVGVNKEWSSSWIADKKEFSNYLVEDNKIRNYIAKKHNGNGIAKVVIERTNKRLTVDIYTSKPGIVIGMKGAGVEELKNDIAKICVGKNININIKEVKRPDLDAALVAESIAVQLEKRVSFRRAMKQAMQRVMKAGAVGCKVMVSGRLDGAEIARSEHYHEGRLPLHTIRADIDYATHEANTTFGVIGVKVWICKGEILSRKPVTTDTTANVGGDELC